MSNEWQIISALVGTSTSSDELGAVIKTLRDQPSRERIIAALGAIIAESQAGIKKNDIDSVNPMAHGSGPPFLASEADNLFRIFRRTLKFSNGDIESWLRDRGYTDRPIGREGLRRYLQRLVAQISESTMNSLARDVAREAAPSEEGSSEVQRFADRLDDYYARDN